MNFVKLSFGLLNVDKINHIELMQEKSPYGETQYTIYGDGFEVVINQSEYKKFIMALEKKNALL